MHVLKYVFWIILKKKKKTRDCSFKFKFDALAVSQGQSVLVFGNKV